jgi:hypothetical protein
MEFLGKKIGRLSTLQVSNKIGKFWKSENNKKIEPFSVQPLW